MFDYPYEKLMQAVDVLATGSGGLRPRLEDAAQFLIRLNDPRELDKLTQPDRQMLVGIIDDLTFESEHNAGEGSIRATLRITSDDDARRIAERIFGLFCRLGRRAWKEP